jgi:hypothetical protein
VGTITAPHIDEERFVKDGLRVTVEQFLSVFFREHFLELRAINIQTKEVSRLFLKHREMSRVRVFLKQHASRELYQGCAERLTESDGSGRGCGKAYVLWCDIDFKDLEEGDARRLLEAFPLKPSIINHSGHGLHCYWLLDRPYNLQSDPERFKELLRRIAFALHGDLKSSECAHVLRAIGTVNHKYAHNPVVTAEHFEPDYRYGLEDFEFLPAQPEPKRGAVRNARSKGDMHPATFITREEKIRRAEAYVATMDPAIQGSGGDHRTYCAGAIVARDFDLSVDDALLVLRSWNARCQHHGARRTSATKLNMRGAGCYSALRM